METYKIKIGTGTDIFTVLQTFKHYCESRNITGNDFDLLFEKVKSTIDDYLARGKKLSEIGGYLQVSQTIKNPLCNVLIDVDFTEKRASLVSRIQSLFKGKK